MPFYRDRDACGQPDEITVIEDKNMMVAGADGSRRPGFELDFCSGEGLPIVAQKCREG